MCPFHSLKCVSSPDEAVTAVRSTENSIFSLYRPLYSTSINHFQTLHLRLLYIDMPASAFQRMPLTVIFMASPFMYTLQCPVWVLNLWKLLIKGQGAWAIYTLFPCKVKMCMLYNYIHIPSMYMSLKVKLSMCTNTPHWALTKSPDTKFLSRLLTQAAKHGGAVRSKQDNE